ncbi:hypothetical protein D9M72_496060 [compost metagenome]
MPKLASTMSARGFSACSTACSRASSAALARSALFSTITSQHSTCATSTSATVRLSSVAGASPRSARNSASLRSRRKVAASTTVTSVSGCTAAPGPAPCSASNRKPSAIASGSSRPSASISSASKRPSAASRAASPSRASPAGSTVASQPGGSGASACPSCGPQTSTAMRRPALCASRWFSSVVLPAPGKPDSTVTGRRSAMAGEVEVTRDYTAQALAALLQQGCEFTRKAGAGTAGRFSMVGRGDGTTKRTRPRQSKRPG